MKEEGLHDERLLSVPKAQWGASSRAGELFPPAVREFFFFRSKFSNSVCVFSDASSFIRSKWWISINMIPSSYCLAVLFILSGILFYLLLDVFVDVAMRFDTLLFIIYFSCVRLTPWTKACYRNCRLASCCIFFSKQNDFLIPFWWWRHLGKQ